MNTPEMEWGINTPCDICGEPNCTVCIPDASYEVKFGYTKTAKSKAIKALGGYCVCCGTTKKLQIDHIYPCKYPADTIEGQEERSKVISDIYKGITENYQVLCKSCNNWKRDGLKCPCSWWDSIDPTWRQRINKKKGTKRNGYNS